MKSPMLLLNPVRAAGALWLTAVSALAVESANWPNWRGPQDNGSTPASALPTKLTAEQIVWQVALPGKGCSTPIVWNDRIYVTAPVEGQDAVLAYDRSGQVVWQTKLGPEKAGRHRNGSGSNPSPVTDGRSVFVTFKSGRTAALGLDGTIRWQADLEEKYGPVKLYWDHGTSPALTEKHVVIARMHGGESWLAAFDKETGDLRWKTDRTYTTPKEVDHGYSTPLVIRHDGREAVLVWGAGHLTSHAAADGALLWSVGEFNPNSTPNWPAVANPVIVDDLAVVCFGRADRGSPRLHGIKLGGQGDVTATNRVWSREDTGAFVPTPAANGGRVYVLSDRGRIDCIEPATGRTVWSGELPRSSSNYYSSPLIAGGLLYAAREDGMVYVARVGEAFELLSENKFEDRLIASFVPMADRLLVRGEGHLYCYAAK
jgi:outer membrane protein assembly factor BamB